jgi:hypothetical protein
MRLIPLHRASSIVGPIRRLASSVALATATLAGRLDAQRTSIRPELRVDMIAARATSVHAGAGLTMTGAGYARATIIAAAGVTSFRDSTGAAGRVDVVGRFLLDPYREMRWGLYGFGGLSALYDRFADWRGVLTIGVGLELPAHGDGVWAIEIGFGGGLRAGATLRRSGRGRR